MGLFYEYKCDTCGAIQKDLMNHIKVPHTTEPKTMDEAKFVEWYLCKPCLQALIDWLNKRKSAMR